MNKKGASIGGYILFFIGVIVALTLIVTTAQNVGTMTNTITVANESTGVATNTTAVYLTNYRAISDVVVYNATGDYLIGASNYTVVNNVVNDGALAVEITPHVADADYLYNWVISGTGQPLTYADDSASRSIAGLIVLMGALAILGFALWFFGKESGWLRV